MADLQPAKSNVVHACGVEQTLLGVQCQNEFGHDGPHRHEDEQGIATWEPRYVGELRRDLDEAVRLLANATDPENAGDWDEAREVGWAWAKEREQP